MDFHNRQYDPQVCRFLSVDPLAAATAGMSSYTGMNNNPTSTVDPLGLTGIEIISWVDYAPTRMDQLLMMSPSVSMDQLGITDDLRNYNEKIVAAAKAREQARKTKQHAATQAWTGKVDRTVGSVKCNRFSSDRPTANEVYGVGGGNSEGGDPQSGQGNKRELPKGMDPVDSDDPKKSSNGERVYSLEEFAEYNKGLNYKEIINQRPKRTGGAGGPDLRYVLNPVDGNIMDMRHVLVVGYGYGTTIGKAVEAAQWLTKETRRSSFNLQDYYSNKVGDNFRSWYFNGFKTEFRPNFPDFSHAFQHYILYHKFNR